MNNNLKVIFSFNFSPASSLQLLSHLVSRQCEWNFLLSKRFKMTFTMKLIMTKRINLLINKIKLNLIRFNLIHLNEM